MAGTATTDAHSPDTMPRSGLNPLPVYAVTLFLSALLLFWVQPLFGKMILPLLGGVPAVWNTAMMFFQAVLFGGYVYAHLSSRYLPPRIQVLVHLGLFGTALIVLPLGLPAAVVPPEDAMPVTWLLGLLGLTVGLPFFALSGCAPLLQRWFSGTGHPDAADPYFLYGASNVGSLLALLAYPVLFEPQLGLGQQGVVWSVLFVLLAALIGFCAWLRRGAAVAPVSGSTAGSQLSDSVSWRDRLWWLTLSFVPASLLLGVTSHITTDVAAAPLLWILPLALYLLTFVFVFARRQIISARWMARLAGPFLVLAALTMWLRIESVQLAILIHLAAFFVIAMVCHGRLAASRPAAEHLTQFYAIMSLGGVLGGIFNALVAPVAFSSVLEYPMALAAAGLLLPWERGAAQKGMRAAITRAAPALFIAVALMFMPLSGAPREAVMVILAAGVIAAFGLALAFNPPPLLTAIAVALVAFIPVRGYVLSTGGIAVESERSFFGTYKIRIGQLSLAPGAGPSRGAAADQINVSALYHGTTLHGAEINDGAARPTPTTYFYREGAFGEIMTYWGLFNPQGRVAVAGLGIGTAACYARERQTWTFYEIDPAVTALAQDTRYFTFLEKCLPDARIVHGDARIRLRDVAPGTVDFLVLDAFSSDAIPVHLMTVEAIREYKEILSPDGYMLFQITNRHIDLAPVLARVARETGMAGRVFNSPGGSPQNVGNARGKVYEAFKLPGTFVLLARSEGALALFDGLASSTSLDAQPDAPLWTDDHSDILRALRW